MARAPLLIAAAASSTAQQVLNPFMRRILRDGIGAPARGSDSHRAGAPEDLQDLGVQAGVRGNDVDPARAVVAVAADLRLPLTHLHPHRIACRGACRSAPADAGADPDQAALVLGQRRDDAVDDGRRATARVTAPAAW